MHITYKEISTGKIFSKEFSSAFRCRRFIDKIDSSKKWEIVWFPDWVLVGRR